MNNPTVVGPGEGVHCSRRNNNLMVEQMCYCGPKTRNKLSRCASSVKKEPKRVFDWECLMRLQTMDRKHHHRNCVKKYINCVPNTHTNTALGKRLNSAGGDQNLTSIQGTASLIYEDSHQMEYGGMPPKITCYEPQMSSPFVQLTPNITRYSLVKRRRRSLFVESLWGWPMILLLILIPVSVQSSECQACIGVPCQKVMGLFTRSPLPVGYNVIATIPARACNLTVRETANTNNYLALRSRNRYIINGNWDVQPSGRYMGAGTGFVYSHPTRALDALRLVGGAPSRADTLPAQGEKIESPGPFTQQLELMVIYQEANMGISYEYWSPLLSSEVTSAELHIGRIAEATDSTHPNQLFQNLVRNQVREVPDGTPRRSSNQRGRINSRRSPFRRVIQETPEAGNIKDPVLIPLPSRRRGSTTRADSRRLPNQRNRRRKGRRRKPSSNLHNIQPAFSSSTNFHAQQNQVSRAQPTLVHEPHSPLVSPILEPIPTNRLQQPVIDPISGIYGNSIPEYNVTDIMFPAWKMWQFTPCSRSCGGGTQQALHICTSLSGHVVSESLCGGEASRPVEQTMECNTKPCPPEWQLSDWSPCSATCGSGMQSRTWACIQVVNPTLTRAVSPTLCPMPSMTHVPLTKPCSVGDCTRWSAHTWSACSVECGTGVQNRDVLCLMESEAVTSVLPDAACNEQERPPRQQLCHAASCGRNVWFFTEWSSQCIGGCENGQQYRKVWCSSLTQSGGRGSCPARSRPPESQRCSKDASCAAIWFTGPWTQCSVECGGGNRTREVVCVVFLRGSFRATLDLECDAKTRPVGREPCNSLVCPPHWYFTEWTPCSRSCGRGSQERAVQCLDSNQIQSVQCSLSDRPSRTRVCNLSKCSTHINLSRDEPGYRQNSFVAATGRRSSSTACIDRFRNCKLVQQARLCRFSYYNTVCCESCGG